MASQVLVHGYIAVPVALGDDAVKRVAAAIVAYKGGERDLSSWFGPGNRGYASFTIPFARSLKNTGENDVVSLQQDFEKLIRNFDVTMTALLGIDNEEGDEWRQISYTYDPGDSGHGGTWHRAIANIASESWLPWNPTDH